MTYESVISGNIGSSALITDNCYHVLRFSMSLTLERVTIADGYADFEYSNEENRPKLNGFGGALITETNTAFEDQIVNINNVIFRDNVAINGGALWFGASIDHSVTVTITDSTFENNKAINGTLLL